MEVGNTDNREIHLCVWGIHLKEGSGGEAEATDMKIKSTE